MIVTIWQRYNPKTESQRRSWGVGTWRGVWAELINKKVVRLDEEIDVRVNNNEVME